MRARITECHVAVIAAIHYRGDELVDEDRIYPVTAFEVPEP